MNDKKSQYWVWKNTIIDFDNLSNEKNEYGGYITKKDLIFSQLGTPDKEIHEWYNGKYSSEYNEAYKYAYELNLIEHYRDYEDEIDKLQSNWNSLRELVRWRPIEEYDENKYDWVLVKYYDGDYECVPTVAEQRKGTNKWYDTNNNEIIFEVKYFYDMQLLDKMNELEGKD